MQQLPVGRTVWHITFGTYGARLHGGNAATVDRQHNQRGAPVLGKDEKRRNAESDRMPGDPVFLAAPQRAVIETIIPALCERGGWKYYTCAAPPEPDNNHVHTVLDADPSADGKIIRELLKRWLTQHLNQKWPLSNDQRWWAVGGSTKPVSDQRYFNNVLNYVSDQRTLPVLS